MVPAVEDDPLLLEERCSTNDVVEGRGDGRAADAMAAFRSRRLSLWGGLPGSTVADDRVLWTVETLLELWRRWLLRRFVRDSGCF